MPASLFTSPLVGGFEEYDEGYDGDSDGSVTDQQNNVSGSGKRATLPRKAVDVLKQWLFQHVLVRANL